MEIPPNLIPLTHYLNSNGCPGLIPGQELWYQNVNHPSNGPKRKVTFKKYSNTGILLEEIIGSIYSGNLWIEVNTL